MDSQNPPKSPPYINPQIQYSQVKPSFQNLLYNQMSSFSLQNFDPFTTSQQTPFFSPEILTLLHHTNQMKHYIYLQVLMNQDKELK